MRYSSRLLTASEREARLFLYFDNHEGYPSEKSGTTRLAFRLRTDTGVVEVCQLLWCLAHDLSVRHLGNMRAKNRAQCLVPVRHGLTGRRSNGVVKDSQRDDIRAFATDLAQRVGVAVDHLDPVADATLLASLGSAGPDARVLPREWTFASAHRAYVHFVQQREGGVGEGEEDGDGGGDGEGGLGIGEGEEDGDGDGDGVRPDGVLVATAGADGRPVQGALVEGSAVVGSLTVRGGRGGRRGARGAAAGPPAAGGGGGGSGAVRGQKRKRNTWVSPNAFKALWADVCPDIVLRKMGKMDPEAVPPLKHQSDVV